MENRKRQRQEIRALLRELDKYHRRPSGPIVTGRDLFTDAEPEERETRQINN